MQKIKRIPTPYSYSAAVVAGNTVYVGLHRGFGEGFSAQLADALKGVTTTLAQVGLELSSLVKVTVWLKDIHDLPVMEKMFLDYFPPDSFPARMTATTEFIDDDCLVMLEGIASRE
jgi:2-iminobutanoate/2-iminopropanoate deaminase